MKVSRDEIDDALYEAFAERETEETIENIKYNYDSKRHSKRQPIGKRDKRTSTRDEDYTESSM